MTIKDTKTQLVMQKSYALGKDYRALENALDIIRKYEKIQEIFDRYDKGELTHSMFGLFVGEVLEDGKGD